MKKIRITLGIVISLGYAYAGAHDCNLVQEKNIEEIIKNFEINYTIYHKFMPVDAFKQATKNMKAYCCNEKIIQCTEKEINNLPKKNYPKSTYIFDHILDITMRRLDGIPGTLVYNLEPDNMGKNRAEFTNQIALAEHGIAANIIEQQYKGYRILHKKTIKTKNIETMVLPKYDTTNTNELSLADKYETVCDISNMLYQKLQKDNKVIIGTYKEPKSFFRKCSNKVKERIRGESDYIQILMIDKSAQLLNETNKAYTQKHFVEDKLMNLRNLVTKVKDLFQTTVNKAATSSSCNK